MSALNPKRETASLRPVPWRGVIISAVIGTVMLGGVVYMYRQKTTPPEARKSSAKISTPVANKTPHVTETTSVVAREKIEEAREGLTQLVTAAGQQLEKAHALATGPEAAKLRAKIEETRVQIENYSYTSADKAGDALGRAVENSREIATELRNSGKGDLATDIETTVSQWKEGAAKLIDEGREIVNSNDAVTTSR